MREGGVKWVPLKTNKNAWLSIENKLRPQKIWSNMDMKYVEMVPMVEQKGYPRLLCRHQDPAAGGFQTGNFGKFTIFHHEQTGFQNVPNLRRFASVRDVSSWGSSLMRANWLVSACQAQIQIGDRSNQKTETKGTGDFSENFSHVQSGVAATLCQTAKPVLERIQRYPNISH